MEFQKREFQEQLTLSTLFLPFQLISYLNWTRCNPLTEKFQNFIKKSTIGVVIAFLWTWRVTLYHSSIKVTGRLDIGAMICALPTQKILTFVMLLLEAGGAKTVSNIN